MLERTAYYLKDSSNQPNIELAQFLCANEDVNGIQQIVDGLSSAEPALCSDCIKVLYEAAALRPDLIAKHVISFIQLLKSGNNRLVWGSMTALARIAALKPDEIYENINIIKSAFEKGSVITRDNAVSVFSEICKARRDTTEDLQELLFDHLTRCREKEVAQHAERTSICIDSKNADQFRATLLSRYTEVSEPQRKRLDKVIMSLPLKQ